MARALLDLPGFLALFTICLIMVGLVWWSESAKKVDEAKAEIGRGICKDLNLSYVGVFPVSLKQQEVRCSLNKTFISEHYNLTPEPAIIHIQVDWGYYQNEGNHNG